MGDELGRTQLGNNNPYCLDNKITWVDWSLAKKPAFGSIVILNAVHIYHAIFHLIKTTDC